MVVLVPVDERLTEPGAPGLAELRTVGVEPLVEAVLRSESGDGASFGAPAACDTPAGGIPAAMHPRTFLAIDPQDHQVVGTCGFSGPLRGGRIGPSFLLPVTGNEAGARFGNRIQCASPPAGRLGTGAGSCPHAQTLMERLVRTSGMSPYVSPRLRALCPRESA